jgi:hypothetical protein
MSATFRAMETPSGESGLGFLGERSQFLLLQSRFHSGQAVAQGDGKASKGLSPAGDEILVGTPSE